MRNNPNYLNNILGAASSWLKVGFFLFFMANILAIALLALRSPVVTYHEDIATIFGRSLVLHVSFSLWGWNLCCLIGLAYKLMNKSVGFATKPSLSLFMAGILLMIISALIGDGQPVLSNYLPIIDHVTFLIGLTLSGIIITIQLLWLSWLCFQKIRNCLSDLTTIALFASLISALYALFHILFNGYYMATVVGQSLSYEQIFWGGGHIMMCSLLFTLLALCSKFAVQIKEDQIKSKVASIWTLLTLFILIIWSVGATIESFESNYSRALFTNLMAFHTVVLAPLFVYVLVRGKILSSPLGSKSPQHRAILTSVALLLLGAGIGSIINSESLLVPAHYHAVTGALNLLFLQLIIQTFLPACSAANVRLRLLRAPIVYGVGVILLSVGLTLAGIVGIGRKTVGIDETGATLMGYTGLSMAIAGGLIAILSIFFLTGKLFPYIRGSKQTLNENNTVFNTVELKASEFKINNSMFKNKGRYESTQL